VLIGGVTDGAPPLHNLYAQVAAVQYYYMLLLLLSSQQLTDRWICLYMFQFERLLQTRRENKNKSRLRRDERIQSRARARRRAATEDIDGLKSSNHIE